MSSWRTSERLPASASTPATTSSGQKLSRIRATSSHRKYAVSGISPRLTIETTNEAHTRRISAPATVHWTCTEPERHASMRALT